MPAPIALFAYNRPEHLSWTLASLKANLLADQSDLHIYCDGMKDVVTALSPDLPPDAQATELLDTQAKQADTRVDRVASVRRIAHETTGFRSVRVVEREKNYGLSANITKGVTELVEEYGTVVVLEDDMLLSPHFLKFMNDGLACYADNDKVSEISGFCFPYVTSRPPETFFLKGADCWGWATWQRAWRWYEPDGKLLLAEIEKRKLQREFDSGCMYPYVRMLKEQIAGSNDSWAIRWHASAFLRGMMALYPARSLVFQVGFDGSGTHCDDSGLLQQKSLGLFIDVTPIPVVESPKMRHHISQWYRQTTKKHLRTIRRKLCFKIRDILYR